MCPLSRAQLLQLAGCDMFGRSGQPLHIIQWAEIHKTGMFISNHIHSVIELLMTTLDITWEGCVRSSSTEDYTQSLLRLVHVMKPAANFDKYFQRSYNSAAHWYERHYVFSLLTLLPWSRVRTRSLSTCVSAMSALSSASSSSCWSFLYLDRLELACSSCREKTNRTVQCTVNCRGAPALQLFLHYMNQHSFG